MVTAATGRSMDGGPAIFPERALSLPPPRPPFSHQLSPWA
jgi:hypothetical protein